MGLAIVIALVGINITLTGIMFQLMRIAEAIEKGGN